MNVRRTSPPRAGAAAGAAGLTLALLLAGCGGIQAERQAARVAVPAAQPVTVPAAQMPGAAQPAGIHHGTSAHLPASAAEMRLRVRMRLLWTQHMEWTYATVAAFAADSKGLQPTLDRLLVNQGDIGAAIRPYYGRAAAERLTDLLRTHINDAVPVLVSARAGDTEGLHTAVTAWYANARQIADFLADANPNWHRGEMRMMMHRHITQTIAYASDQLNGQYDRSIVDYGKAEAHMMQMSDMLTAGIVVEFPQRFDD